MKRKRYNVEIRVDGEALRIGSGSCLTENDEIVQSVINEEIKIETLILESTQEDTFTETFRKSKAFKRFWSNLGKNATFLELNLQTPSSWEHLQFDSYFTNLKELHIMNDHGLESISPEFCHANPDLETIMLGTEGISFDMVTEGVEAHEKFVKILENCKFLKKIVFGCLIPLEANTISEIFLQINHRLWGMDELMFDCAPLPSWTDYENYYWTIETIEINLIRNEETSKMVVKPLKIRDKLRAGQNECEDNCSIKHRVFKSESVTDVSFQIESNHRCYGYLRSCFESFSCTEKLSGINCDLRILNWMSQHLRHLCDLEYVDFDYEIERWPPFPYLRAIKIGFERTTYQSLESFVETYINLKKLSIQIEEGITDDECAKLISENLKELECLELYCGESCLTTIGLHYIGNNVKKLEKLDICCSESQFEIKRMCERLPMLEEIHCNSLPFEWNGSVTSDESDTESLNDLEPNLIIGDGYQTNKDVHFPIAVLEEIVLFLKTNDRLACRLVNTHWFNIFSSSRKLDRTLNFFNSFLSNGSDPVNIFLNTNFKYNRIVIGARTTINANDNLTKFWEIIGSEIEEFFLVIHASAMINAFKSGLTVEHFPKLRHIVFDISMPQFNDLLLKDIPIWKTFLAKIEKITIRDPDISLTLNSEFEHTNFEMTNVQVLHVHQKSDEMLDYLSHLSFPHIREFLISYNSMMPLDTLFKVPKLNFFQLEYLFVKKRFDEWHVNDFLLMSQNCHKIKGLGIGLSDEFYHFVNRELTFSSTSKNYFDLEVIVQMMFDKLLWLCDIYFVIVSDPSRKIKQRKLYSRTSVNSFTATEQSFRRFDEFYLFALKYPAYQFIEPDFRDHMS